MAGGSGTRLWPSSRKNFPKQFLRMGTEESFIQLTARRLAPLAGADAVYVVTDGNYNFNVINQLSAVFARSYDRVILEPAGRNTAPAIALTIRYMLDKAGAKPDDLLFFSPSDHLIRPEETLRQAIAAAAESAGSSIVTFGIVPDKPETGYGYIELGAPAAGFLRRVSAFREKPDRATAERFVASGNFMWNSGMFLFSIATMLAAFAKHAPELARACATLSFDEMTAAYETLPRQSIDYAIMEKADNILCAPLDIEWNDIGSWDSVHEVLPHDAAGNATVGNVRCMDSEDNLVMADGRLVTLLGVSGLAVIDTPDALLVCKRSDSQRVKDLVGEIQQTDPAVTAEHVTTYRPWGRFTILEEGPRCKIKRIVVNPGARLSLQRHLHRSEHWVVVTGSAEVTIGDKVESLHENQSVYVPINEVHRLANPGKIPLEIIEVQNGEYVGEDDIIRLEDTYGRL